MPVVKIKDSDKVIPYSIGDSLLEVLLKEGIFVDNPCNGKGVCGKCKVKVLDGNLEEASDTERKFLSEKELKQGVRLSCLINPTDDLVVEPIYKERRHKVLTSGHIPDFEFCTNVKKVPVTINKPTLDNQTPYEEQILNQSNAKYIEFNVLRDCNFTSGDYTVVVYDDTVIAIEKGDTVEKLYGVAIDIGTTTVVCELVDMNSGEQMANSSMINAQKHFGLDVLTRISYELENRDVGADNLRNAIVDSINDMIDDVCFQTGVCKENIYEISVGANCTMMHMLLGVDATSIGKSPYAPIFTSSKTIKSELIGVKAAKNAMLYCLPSVSSYIGADIVAGAYVCDLQHKNENVLFIDIGTNGEIVLSKSGKLLCCSCAAGPALEGMNISSGMRAAEGAIEDVVINEEGIGLKVIGDEEPIGICGSGILAVVKELIKCGIVRKEGAFIKKEKLDGSDYRYNMIQMNGKKREFILYDGKDKILITQGDIRQVQLAKGAILSGFIALLNKAGISMDKLDKVMIAGQFGAHLSADSLTGTGILPQNIEDKLVYVGNSSKTGAYMALMSSKVKNEMQDLAKNMDYMELGATEGYERLFSECLIFPE